MIRTTSERVAEIIEVDEAIPLAPFISAASSLVDRIRDRAITFDMLRDGVESGDLSRDDKLEQIEKFLSAHFYTLREPRPTDEKAGSVGSTYQSAVDLRLFTSHYGQMAVVLDETGLLEEINAGKQQPTKIGVTWLGRRCP